MEKKKHKPIEKVSEKEPAPSTSKQNDQTEENQRTTASTASENLAILSAQLQSSQRRGSKKPKRQSVFRASVVAPELEIIAPLPRMSYDVEETTEKLKRMIKKLDTIVLDED